MVVILFPSLIPLSPIGIFKFNLDVFKIYNISPSIFKTHLSVNLLITFEVNSFDLHKINISNCPLIEKDTLTISLPL